MYCIVELLFGSRGGFELDGQGLNIHLKWTFTKELTLILSLSL